MIKNIVKFALITLMVGAFAFSTSAFTGGGVSVMYMSGMDALYCNEHPSQSTLIGIHPMFYLFLVVLAVITVYSLYLHKSHASTLFRTVLLCCVIAAWVTSISVFGVLANYYIYKSTHVSWCGDVVPLINDCRIARIERGNQITPDSPLIVQLKNGQRFQVKETDMLEVVLDQAINGVYDRCGGVPHSIRAALSSTSPFPAMGPYAQILDILARAVVNTMNDGLTN